MSIAEDARAMIRNNTSLEKLMCVGGYVSVREDRLVEVVGNTFTANGAYSGGAVSCDGNSARIERNMFESNYATEAGGAMAVVGGSSSRVVNNVFAHNHANNGGALYTTATPKVVNNTFVGNQATGNEMLSGYGGAVLAYDYTANPLLVNNIFWKNLSNQQYSYGNSVACLFDASTELLYCRAFSDVSASNTYHYLLPIGVPPGAGCSAHIPSSGSIFADELAGDYRLLVPGPSYSPVDEGHNAVADDDDYGLVPFADYDGNPRPGGAACDMGAFEVQVD